MKKMSNMRMLLTAAFLLTVPLYLSSCRGSNSDQNTMGDIPAASDIMPESFSIEAASGFDTQTENQDVVTIDTSESEAAADTEYGEYTYSPPAAALDADFVRDNIICRVNYRYYSNDGTAELPGFILADMNSYADEFISGAEGNHKLERLGVFMFDINSDGLDDYIVIGEIDENDAVPYPPCTIEKLYIQDGNNGFQAIDFPASSSKYGIEDYILSTKTNGYNDFIGIGVDGFFTAVYDGNNKYSESEVFCECDYRWEYLDNELVRITITVPENAHENEIAAAKFFYDTDHAEHMLLYSSLPDGTPSGSIPQYSSDRFEFYVKRTDKAPENQYDWAAGPIEVRFIPADRS